MSKIEISKSEILACVQSGMTDKEIGEKFNCSESTAQRIRKDYGIGRYVFIYNKGQYERMKQVGLSDEEVCFVWGVSRRHLNQWKYREGLTNKYKQVHKLDRDEKERKFTHKKELVK